MNVLDFSNGGKPAFVYTFEMYKHESNSDYSQKETKGEDLGFFDSLVQILMTIIDFFTQIVNVIFQGV